MPKISVKLTASSRSRSKTFDFEDLNTTQEDWDKMTDEEKQSAIIEAVDIIVEQPYWEVDGFTEEA